MSQEGTKRNPPPRQGSGCFIKRLSELNKLISLSLSRYKRPKRSCMWNALPIIHRGEARNVYALQCNTQQENVPLSVLVFRLSCYAASAKREREMSSTRMSTASLCSAVLGFSFTLRFNRKVTARESGRFAFFGRSRSSAQGKSLKVN